MRIYPSQESVHYLNLENMNRATSSSLSPSSPNEDFVMSDIQMTGSSRSRRGSRASSSTPSSPPATSSAHRTLLSPPPLGSIPIVVAANKSFSAEDANRSKQPPVGAIPVTLPSSKELFDFAHKLACCVLKLNNKQHC